MFTGIVEETGAVLELAHSSAGARMVVAAREVVADLSSGGSIAVNGCCLTAVDFDERGFSADLSPETLARTNLGALGAGSLVNLERPLLPTSRLSGHFVLGHVRRHWRGAGARRRWRRELVAVGARATGPAAVLGLQGQHRH